MESLLIAAHVIAGGAVLLLGLTIALIKKGTSTHRKIGFIYVLSMWVVCLSAFLMLIFVRFNIFLLVIAILTFYSSYTGYRVINRKEPGSEKWFDWMFAALALTSGISLIGYGFFLFVKVGGFDILGALSILFGYFTAKGGFDDLVVFVKKPLQIKLWWLRHHISAMGGSYIAAVTAFTVQNGEAFLPEFSMNWLFWIIPSVIGSPIISFAIKKRINAEPLTHEVIKSPV